MILPTNFTFEMTQARDPKQKDGFHGIGGIVQGRAESRWAERSNAAYTWAERSWASLLLVGLASILQSIVTGLEQLYESLSCSSSSALCTDYVGIQGTWHDMTWHGMTWHYITLHHTTSHYMPWHDMTLRYIAWHDIAWHCMTSNHIT